MSQKRTFQIISKWIGEHCGVRIQFEANATPTCNVEDRVITLPTNIKDDNVFGALAVVMHEAGHIKYTREHAEEFRKIMKDNVDKMLMNAVEDVRIDRNMFGRLPNARAFFVELYKKGKEGKEDLPDPVKLLITAMVRAEGIDAFRNVRPQTNEGKKKVSEVVDLINRAADNIDYKQYGTLKHNLNRMRKVLGFDEPEKEEKQEKQESKQQQKGEGQGGSGSGDKKEEKKQDEKQEEGKKKPEEKNEDEEKGDEKKEQGQGKTETQEINEALEQKDLANMADGGNVFSLEKGGTGSGQSTFEVGAYGLEEITKTRLKEALDIKSTKVIDDGTTLNTDNALSFFTGDIESLFSEEEVVKSKKTKIMFLLDCSGSMCEVMYSRKRRWEALVQAMKAVTKIFDEVIALEGLNVSYELRAFNGDYHKLDRHDWEKDYMRVIGGSTRILDNFQKILKEITDDVEADGKKLIIVATDGEVHHRDVEGMKKIITNNNSDIMCGIVGIGASLMNNPIIPPEHNILSEENANEVIFNVTTNMLMG